uniref:Uncharacterized protein n=1 Tax=Sphaerodactylus townsendi TaxID=933632 RepID=A0ACB8FF62_9SAUR
MQSLTLLSETALSCGRKLEEIRLLMKPGHALLNWAPEKICEASEFQLRDIAKGPCIAQLFIVHSFSFMESAVLFAMALDRFLAIILCHSEVHGSPDHEAEFSELAWSLLTEAPRCSWPHACFLLHFPLLSEVVLSHSYCLHQDVIRLACSEHLAFQPFSDLIVIVLLWALVASLHPHLLQSDSERQFWA